MHLATNGALNPVLSWFEASGRAPFPFQLEVWNHFLNGISGLLNAPTGSGKTYAVWCGALAWHIKTNATRPDAGLRVLWITPLRALANDLQKAMQHACDSTGLDWTVGIRTGDTSAADKQKYRKQLPEALITTPESLHLMLAQKENAALFKTLETVVIDEWHELLGTKRGTQVELALTRLRAQRPALITWGISATIGNPELAMNALLPFPQHQPAARVKADIQKRIVIESLLPDEVEHFPWAGYLGIRMLEKVVPIIDASKTSLLFTNTRSQAEIWFQKLLDFRPDYAGQIALHHGSLDNAVRSWVEQALHDERLKVVVCTSSLDLGVDFHPVETVFQVGSPKGVARFLQRAGRSGHRPGATSRIYFVPTHSLELVEGSALRFAAENNILEERLELSKPMDVLVQYLVTLAVGDGFVPEELLPEIKTCYTYRELTGEEWQWALECVKTGGKALRSYDDYKKVVVDENGLWRVENKRTALRHRLSIGTIVSDPSMTVSWMSGGSIGTIEEGFIAKLNPGDPFIFAGRNLELVKVKDLTAYVRKSDKKKGQIPSWAGGRVPLSGKLSAILRRRLHEAAGNVLVDPEMQTVQPIFELQSAWSAIPLENQFLIEQTRTKEGFHAFFFPFEGRFVHEGLASLFAWRIGQLQPMTFSLAMNDYGFELLSDQEIPVDEAIQNGLFATENLQEHIRLSLNESELARRRFREIARVAGLVFQGFPGKPVKARHLQSSSTLLFDVFEEFDPENRLVGQAYDEAHRFQLEEERLAQALTRIQTQQWLMMHPPRPTPFCFPIMVDRLQRQSLTSESLESRVAKMTAQLEKYAYGGKR
jgi:ATP-dependent Lhr-like helicase